MPIRRRNHEWHHYNRSAWKSTPDHGEGQHSVIRVLTPLAFHLNWDFCGCRGWPFFRQLLSSLRRTAASEPVARATGYLPPRLRSESQAFRPVVARSISPRRTLRTHMERLTDFRLSNQRLSVFVCGSKKAKLRMGSVRTESRLPTEPHSDSHARSLIP